MSGRRVFVGRLSRNAAEYDVERFFRGFGRINDINIKTGYCFVEFDDARDADDAVYELNNQNLCGERVTVEHAIGVPRNREYDRPRDRDRDYYGGRREFRDSTGRVRPSYFHGRAIEKYGPPLRTKYRVTVQNLSTRVSWQDLKDYLRQAGEITYADAHKHRRNEGVVDFATYGDMKRAIDKLDGTEINGRRIKLIEEDTRDSRSRSRSYSRSRSRSPRAYRRSRSRSRSSRSRSRSGSRNRRSYSRDRRRSASPQRNEHRSETPSD
uniref:Serine/arginine-rich splicing factor 5 n=1 Tax=Phallusia mammillata TaxID=59560 RepID=A0A6F9DT34_9ASCI|nr:serine/arginine-rich splicing factor 5 [Phallusia mammillata]